MMKLNSGRHGLPVIHDRAACIDIGSRFLIVAVPADLHITILSRVGVSGKDGAVHRGVQDLFGVSWDCSYVPAPVPTVLCRNIELCLIQLRQVRAGQDILFGTVSQQASVLKQYHALNLGSDLVNMMCRDDDGVLLLAELTQQVQHRDAGAHV